MEMRAYLQGEMESEKGRMKARLLAWGGTLDLCGRKQEEIRKLEKLREEQKKLWENSDSAEAKQILGEIDKSYAGELKRIQSEIEEILQKKADMDKLLLNLIPEEQNFVVLRFEKGYGFDYISMKLHMSRATLFRMQERILQTLMEVEIL